MITEVGPRSALPLPRTKDGIDMETEIHCSHCRGLTTKLPQCQKTCDAIVRIGSSTFTDSVNTLKRTSLSANHTS